MHDYKAVDCPICGNQKNNELFKAKDRLGLGDALFGIRKCQNCQIVFTFPVLSYGEVKKFYPEHYFWKEDYRGKNKFINLIKKLDGLYFRLLYNREINRLIKFTGAAKQANLLDIGCGDGLRLEILKKNGYSNCSGVELLENEAYYAKNVKKLRVLNATFDEYNCEKNSFDVITLYNVFEHFNNPVESLKKVREILKEQGWLVMEIPNFDSLQMKLFRSRWVDFDVPRHYFYYTKKTISDILAKNGFLIKHIDWTQNFFHPFSWVFSFPSMDPEIVWRNEEKNKQTILHRIWWGILLLLSIPPNIIETLLGKGGHMTIYAINQKLDGGHKYYENTIN